jgi:hypothetical protein
MTCAFSAAFAEMPDADLVADVLAAFGITDLSRTQSFTKHDTDALDTFGRLHALTPRLKAVYKRAVWAEFVTCAHTDRTIIFVLRHFLRMLGFVALAHDRHCLRCGRDKVFTITPAKHVERARFYHGPVRCEWGESVTAALVTAVPTGVPPGAAGMDPRRAGVDRTASAPHESGPCLLV